MSVTIKSIQEKQARLEALQKEIEEDKAAIKKEVIDEIRAKINQMGITAKDLGFKKDTVVKAPIDEKVVKYQRGEDAWGGKGPNPKWIKELKAQGVDIEQYRVSE